MKKGRGVFERRYMNLPLQEKSEKLGIILQRLMEKSGEGALILVEGRRDAEALADIGVTGKIECIKERRIPFYDLLSEYADMDSELIVLTDFDRRGTQLASKIAHYLERRGRPVNLRFWMMVKSLMSGEVKDVEGLPSYLNTLRRRYRNQIAV